MIEVELGKVGIEYVRAVCGDISGICSRINRISANDLVISALVPEGTTRTRAEQLDEGGLTPQDSTINWIVSRAEVRDTSNKNYLLYAQDIWMDLRSPNDLRDQDRINSFVYLGCPYYYISSSILNPSLVGELVLSVKSFQFLMGLSQFDLEVKACDSLAAIYIDQVDGIWNNTLEFYISAFDQESFVVVRPRGGGCFGDVKFIL